MGTVIVIDPGHGGENEGTIEHLYGEVEKEMTLETSKALYDALKEYDGAEVYMTREENVDLSLRERAEYAKSLGADFLFSIHYNASVDHDLYGAEVWIPSDQPYMKKGLDFAIPMLHYFDRQGLFIRGAKTRLNSRGQNYYGIIRESTRLGIPCVIIEHCHVDHEEDVQYCDTHEEMRQFGELDAKCIAGFLGLSKDGKTPETDHSFAGDEQSCFNTWTDPVRCDIEIESADETGATVKVMAEDAESLLLYYDYSTDGGCTFTRRLPMSGYDYFAQKYDREFTLRLDLDRSRDSNIYFRVYNTFDAMKVSKCVRLEAIPELKEKREAAERMAEQKTDQEEEPEMTMVEAPLEIKKPDMEKEKGMIVLWVLLVCALVLTAVLITLLTRRTRR